MNQHQLSEHELYFLLHNGALQPTGPYNKFQVLELVNSSQFSSEDYIFTHNWEFWRKIGEILELPHHETLFTSDGQDPYVVTETFKYMNEHALVGEELYYIAVQHLPAVNITSTIKLSMPKSVILTNHRFCILEPKMIGEPIFDTYPIEYIEGGMRKIKPNRKRGSFSIGLKSGTWIEVNKIPAIQLGQLANLSKYILDLKKNSKGSQALTTAA